jgi:hypothetical protein
VVKISITDGGASTTYATAPATVTVPAGQSSVTFTVTTTSVPSRQVITVTGSANGFSTSGTFGITIG